MTSDNHIDPKALVEAEVGYPDQLGKDERETHAKSLASDIVERLHAGDEAVERHVQEIIQSYYFKAIYEYVKRLKTAVLINPETKDAVLTSRFRGVREIGPSGVVFRTVQLKIWPEMSIMQYRLMIDDEIRKHDIGSKKLETWKLINKILTEANRPEDESVKDGLEAAGHSYTEFEIDDQAMG